MVSASSSKGRPGKDFTGLKFHRITVIRHIPIDEMAKEYSHLRRESGWLCRCDCGVVKVIRTGNMLLTKSCGCLVRETSAENGRKSGTLIKDREQFLAGRVANYYRANARNRGLDWLLSKEHVRDLILSPCHYCKVSSSNTFNTRNSSGEVESLSHNGIDRVDSSKGYVDGNVVPCCKICNTAKLNLTVDEFYDWVRRVHANIPATYRGDLWQT
jgi:hypothetical protein